MLRLMLRVCWILGCRNGFKVFSVRASVVEYMLNPLVEYIALYVLKHGCLLIGIHKLMVEIVWCVS